MTLTQILRLPQVMSLRARGRSSIYNDVSDRLLTEPVIIGPNAVGWPAHEIEAINRAFIAGRSMDDIRSLVDRLHAERQVAA